MHVLVTGGAGFIGSHIVEYHLNKGDRVFAVDNLSTGTLANLSPFMKNPNFRFVEADILTWLELDKATAWADRIYHMAAVVGVHMVLAEPIRVMSTNVAGCERVLRAIKSGGWNPEVILASSSEVYGTDGRVDLAETADLIIRSGATTRWNYSISKLADEALGLSYARKHKMNIIITRFFNTIGPRQTGRYGMVVPNFVEQAISNKPITIFGDGSQSRSFCDVRDTVRLLDRLANNGASMGEIVNVGNNREISIKELAEMVKARTGSASPIQYISYREAYGEDYDDIQRRRPNLEKMFRLTQLKHEWTLEKTLDYLIESARNPLIKKILAA